MGKAAVIYGLFDPRTGALRFLGEALAAGHVGEELKQRMREYGAKHPDKFGDWTAI